MGTSYIGEYPPLKCRSTTEMNKMETTKEKIAEIQFKQVLAKQRELMFIAENIDLFIEELWRKRSETLNEYLNNEKIDVYNLWRGNNINFDFRDTRTSDTIYAKVQQKLGVE